MGDNVDLPVGIRFMPKRLLFHGTSGASAWSSHVQGRSIDRLMKTHKTETEAVLKSHGVQGIYEKYGNVYPTLLPKPYNVRLGVMTISYGFTVGWRLNGVNEQGEANLSNGQGRKTVIPPLGRFFEGLDPMTLGTIEPSAKTFAFSPKKQCNLVNGVMFLVDRNYMEQEKLVQPYAQHQDLEAIYVAPFLPWKAIVGTLFYDQRDFMEWYPTKLWLKEDNAEYREDLRVSLEKHHHDLDKIPVIRDFPENKIDVVGEYTETSVGS